ncbi:MAG: bacteriohemerythrin [Methylomonas sp.]
MLSKYQTLVWADELLIGVPEIDEQHHLLVNMLSETAQSLSVEFRPTQLADLVHDLMSYALYHFETEEALMMKNHYDPELQAKHIQEHRMFAGKIADAQKAISKGKNISPYELLRFLGDWLQNHIQQTDKQLGEFLAATSQPNP